ncbi:hypothetical protein V7417_05130 [Bacillus pumilus]|uniref:hypothetical protein n=1 Tax=Bacillus pumilus TaxID=1408 RepID=UPI002FFF3EB4
MELAMIEGYNLHLYDPQNEKLLIDLKAIQDTEIYFSDEHNTYLIFARNAFLNLEVLKFLGKYQSPTSLESKLGKKKSISIGRECPGHKFKIVAETLGYHPKDNKPQTIHLEFNDTEIISRAELKGRTAEASSMDLIFKVIPVDGEFFKIHY